jgi:dTDP-4-amino-4,6-dideoxygalactose transaminase
VIYDAAHAFGVQFKGESLLRHGDLSVLSFHATKVFTTFEGGAIVCPDAKTKQRIDYLKNFGIADEVTVMAPGINGKMNEVQAAFGMLQLKHIDYVIEQRKVVDRRYRESLSNVPGITVLSELPSTILNYSYFPILVGPQYRISRDALYGQFREADIHARRYFYPLISDMPMYRGLPSATNLPSAKEVSEQILCLPIYHDLAENEQQRVIEIVRGGV